MLLLIFQEFQFFVVVSEAPLSSSFLLYKHDLIYLPRGLQLYLLLFLTSAVLLISAAIIKPGGLKINLCCQVLSLLHTYIANTVQAWVPGGRVIYNFCPVLFPQSLSVPFASFHCQHWVPGGRVFYTFCPVLSHQSLTIANTDQA